MADDSSETRIAYLLSTCPRCRRVRIAMEEQGIEIEMIDVDLLPKIERTKIMDKLRKHRPVVSFPVIQVGEDLTFGATINDLDEIFGG